MLHRRTLLRSLLAAPAVVAAGNIMPVKQMLWTPAPVDELMSSFVSVVAQPHRFVVYDRLSGNALWEGDLPNVHMITGDTIVFDQLKLTLG